MVGVKGRALKTCFKKVLIEVVRQNCGKVAALEKGVLIIPPSPRLPLNLEGQLLCKMHLSESGMAGSKERLGSS